MQLKVFVKVNFFNGDAKGLTAETQRTQREERNAQLICIRSGGLLGRLFGPRDKKKMWRVQLKTAPN